MLSLTLLLGSMFLFPVPFSVAIILLGEERAGLYEPRHGKTCLLGFRPG